MSLPIAEFSLRTERDVTWAAQRARLLGTLAGVPQKQRTALGKAVAQIARNAVTHGGGGTITFAVAEMDGKDVIEAVVRDHGPGIVDLQVALDQATQRQSGIGLASQLVNEINVDNQTPGLTVRLRQLAPAKVKLSSLPISEWGTALAMRTSQSALEQSQQRIGELGNRLLSLEQRGESLEQQLGQIQSLNESLELLALVASKTANAVVITDTSGQIEWVNEGFEQMTGYAASEVRGGSLVEFFQDPGADLAPGDELRHAFASGHGVTLDARHRRKDGDTYWASLSLTPTFDGQGSVSRWICIGNDISRRREAQEELRQARDMAEAASRAKSMFLANMSHEIRTPMNVVMGMTHLALQTQVTEEQREYLTALDGAAASLLRLLNDLLDLSKIEAGKMEIDPAPFALRELLKTTLTPLATHARQKQLEFRWRVADEIPQVLVGDDTRLQQVLNNLVTNAIKFTPSGRVSVDVESQWQSEGELGLVFVIRDTGIGVSADKLQSIFDAFTQADASTSRHYGGSGMGLAICSHLVDLMGGRIWVESRVGEGSCFRFTVRMGIGEATDVAAIEPVASAPAARSLRVLIADDNPANRLLIERILQKRGHQVVHAVNGREAVEAVKRQAFDIALLDVQMPELDGFQAAALLRENERDRDSRLPLIAVTASAMKSDRDRCLAAGMDAFLSKPIDANDLLTTIESLGAGKESPSIAPSTSMARDFSAALARVENDVEILAEQMEMFLLESPALLCEIHEAVAHSDGPKLTLYAHRLRGFAANFDANEVVAAAAELEDLGRAGVMHESLEKCRELESSLAHLRIQLEAFLHQQSSSR